MKNGVNVWISRREKELRSRCPKVDIVKYGNKIKHHIIHGTQP